MTANTQQSEKIASREATDWFLLLGEEPDDAVLRRDFEAWLAQNPGNQTAWYAMVQASDAMDKATPVHAEKWQPLLAQTRSDALEKPADQAQRSAPVSPVSPVSPNAGQGSIARKSSRFGRGGGVGRLGRLTTFAGAGFVLAACLVAVVLNGPSVVRDLQSDYATGTGETRTVMLEDGSTVTLAPESAITVAYQAGERDVRLLDGEAFFEVTPNPERPFRVTTQDVKTIVLGTAFDVSRGEDGVDVSVEHGRVRVDYANDTNTDSDKGSLPSVTEILGAGQSVHMGWSGIATRSEKPVSHVAAWRQNQLIARDQPLGIVIDQLRRYYDGKIIVLDDVLSAQPVTGVYNLVDPVEALYGIARAQKADMWQISPWIVVVSR